MNNKIEYKFDARDNFPRKQRFFSNEDDYFLYRKHIFNFSLKICEYIQNNPGISVLEIGPSKNSYKENAYPEFNSSIIKTASTHAGIYKTLDIDPLSGCDFICSIEDMSSISEKFNVVILLEVLEHVKNIFDVPNNLYNILNKNGIVFIHTPYLFKVHGPIPDYWRFSAYAYEALFDKLFYIKDISVFPEHELGKNSFPLCLGVTLQKR